LAERLNEATLDGLTFFGARLLRPGDAKLSQVIHEAVYVAGLPRSTLEAVGCSDSESLRALIEERMQGELRARRTIEGIGKWVDVKRYLGAVEVGAGAQTLADAGIVGDLTSVRIQLRITDAGTAKVSEALATLLGQDELPARFVREQLLWRSEGTVGEPLDLERLRDVQQPKTPIMLQHAAPTAPVTVSEP
jgi:hypothetical protein